MKIIAITQARTGSSRFPNKVMNTIDDKSLLRIHVDRIKKSKKLCAIIIATTNECKDDVIELESKELNVSCYRGDEEDVLDRFYQAAEPYNPDFIVRLTSDCPLIDPHLIDLIIDSAINANVDYCSNTLIESYPDGQDVEVFTFRALKKAWEKSTLLSDREHVTPYMKKHFKSLNVASDNAKYGKVRMTVDEPNDLIVIRQMVDKLGLNRTWRSYANLYLKDHTISAKNDFIPRNEGYLKSINNELNK